MKIEKRIDRTLTEIEVLVNCRNDEEFQKIFSKLDNRLSLDTVDGIRRISEAELVYIEVVGNYLELHTSERLFRLRSPLYKFMDKLSSDFLQISRSYVINFEKLNSVETDLVLGMVARVGSKNVKIPISRTYLKSLKKKVGEIK
ncbi:MAG: LytTR family transcriptional regulator [Streptococcaceae bacterium]|jgi:DNA-binding LytR/AlgR family response regulator|nr:LytTR family transcriptional regulator [Streptococcaceae bacterium]